MLNCSALTAINCEEAVDSGGFPIADRGVLVAVFLEKQRRKIGEKMERKGYFAHETAIIDENVSIGKGTKIWCFSHILKNAIVGERCSFGQNCVVGANVKIGDGVRVQNNVSIYEGVEVEDDVFLGPSMVFTNVSNPRAFIERKHEFKTTLVKKGCSIGANATIICGVTIGKYSLIGAGSVVAEDVPDFALVYGVPAKLRGWVGISGFRLNFDKEGFAVDKSDGRGYRLVDGKVAEILNDRSYFGGFDGFF